MRKRARRRRLRSRHRFCSCCLRRLLCVSYPITSLTFGRIHALWDALEVPVAERVAEGVEAAERVEVQEAVAEAEDVGGRHARTALSGGNAKEPGRGTHVAVGCGV